MAVRPCGGDQARQRVALAPLLVEVAWLEPLLVRAAQGRPFAIQDREPRGVAVAALVDDGLAEDALELEPQPRGGTRDGSLRLSHFHS